MRSSDIGNAESGRAEEGVPANRAMAFQFIGAVSQFRDNFDIYKWYKSSISTIRFLSVMNGTLSLVGVIFMILARFPPDDWQSQHLKLLHTGQTMSFISPISLFADLLALRGLRTWKRLYLLPWLAVYAVLLGLVFAAFVIEIYYYRILWRLLVLGWSTTVIFTWWKQISIQYRLMALYAEPPIQRAFNDLAAEVLASGALDEAIASVATRPPSDSSAPKDLPPPPKYEDLEQPPQYEDVMGKNEAQNPGPNGPSTKI